MKKNQFRAPWDNLLRTITLSIIALLIVINILTDMASGIAPLLAIAIIGGCAIYGVYGYSIQEGSLRILRLGWSTNFALDEIESVSFMPDAMMGSIRLFGNGGLFAYVGQFRNGILGNYRAFVTDRKRTVVIRLKNKKTIVISPDDPESFVSHFTTP